MPIESSYRINWKRIAGAVQFYVLHKGYVEIEVPWIVSREATKITLPADAKPFAVEGCGDLIGSAEQSFIQMMMDGRMGSYKNLSVTPCFRDEEVDEIHQKHFMKVELIDCRPNEHFETILNDAEDFMKPYLRMGGDLKRQEVSENQIDLMFECDWYDNPIEVGSYGARSFLHDGIEYKWNYGTGLAEPRFSRVTRYPY